MEDRIIRSGSCGLSSLVVMSNTFTVGDEIVGSLGSRCLLWRGLVVFIIVVYDYDLLWRLPTKELVPIHRFVFDPSPLFRARHIL